MDKSLLNEYNDIHLANYSQQFKGMYFHPEGGGDFFINDGMSQIQKDLNNLDDILINTGNSINNLLSNTILRLDEVRKAIVSEKERHQDIMMLCNKYTDFDNVKALTDLTFTGLYDISDNVYSAKATKKFDINLAVADIFGNGYEGNKYVYNNFAYQQDTYDTSNRKNLIDSQVSTYYEYSRITIQDVEEITNSDFNRDSEYARCTISIVAEKAINLLDISTEDMDIVITEIQYSNDGVSYEILDTPMISLNNSLDSYNNYGYVYGSGLISTPLAKYFKLTFETKKNKDDIIAYERTVFNNKLVNRDEIPKTYTSTSVIKSAKRSVIKINDIKGYQKYYNTSTTIKSTELITAESYAISVFCNVYIPKGLTDDSVKFYLTVNGKEYEVVPINSNLNGTKVIRFSGGKSSTSYTQLISEKITSAYLTIVLKNNSDATPYINNLKVMVGGEL